MNKRFGLGMVAVTVLATGCASEFRTGGNIGGANVNAKRPGNIPGGIAVRSGDIAVDPNNNYFITLKGGTVVTGDMARQDARPLGEIPRPDKLAFWAPSRGDGFVVLHKVQDGRFKVVSFDRANNKVLWQQELSGDYRKLDITAERVIVSGQDVRLLNAATGETAGTYSTDVAIRDVKVFDQGRRMVVVEETRWNAGPSVHMSVRNTDDNTQVCEVDANNCSDDVTVSKDESRVFLAPTLCNQDPITVMSVQDGNCGVEKQMAGFGPVALSPSGDLLVGFLDRDAAEPEGAVVPADVKSSRQKYHLMLIDPVSLDYTTVPAGDELPRYTFTPDGARLLVDSPMDIGSHIRVLDLATGTLTETSGPPVKLNAFTLSPDSMKAFVADGQLFHLDIPSATVKVSGVGVPPDGLNMSVDGVTLLVTQVTDRVMLFMDAAKVREQNRVYY